MKNIKKIEVLLATVFLTVGTTNIALANEKTISYKDIAGITPDNIFYPIDKLMDNLSVKFKTNEIVTKFN